MKQFLVMTGPFGTKSGYGEHARDIFYSLHDLDRFDIKLIDTAWGDTPRDFLNSKDEKHQLILNRIIRNPNNQITKQPDIYVDCRIPNEFETPGKFNIGITAGVETTSVSSKWIQDCNRMDLVIVPSEHSKKGFVDTKYDKMQNLPNGQQQKVGELRLEKPMEVLFEGADENIYKFIKHDKLETDISGLLDDIEEKYCFLFLGQWTQGGFGEDRKNISNLLKSFYEAFANQKKQPALILKTNGAGHSIMDKETILAKIEEVKKLFPKFVQLPKVYLLHGHLSNKEVNELYNHPKVKAMVSMTHGEGFGRPLLEATMVGLPVIAPGWSGQLDFLDKNHSLLVGGELVDLPNSMVWEDVLIKESKWFNPSNEEMSNLLSFAFKNPYDVRENAKKLMEINREKFTHKKMTEKLGEIFDEHINISKNVEVKLPELTKKKTKIKLPKLQKLQTEKV